VRGADYVIKRLAFAVLTVFIAVTINFALFRLAPGSAVTNLARVPHTTLMINHGLSTAARFADRIAVMYLGWIVEQGPAAAVVSDPQHPYTKALLSVVPRRDPRDRTRAQILRGEAPDAVRIPAGCRFHPRCPIAIAECREIDPALEPAGSGVGHEAACILAG
jgi:oligopeptide/dipeptide ABC transporter ATP-binding protein